MGDFLGGAAEAPMAEAPPMEAPVADVPPMDAMGTAPQGPMDMLGGLAQAPIQMLGGLGGLLGGGLAPQPMNNMAPSSLQPLSGPLSNPLGNPLNSPLGNIPNNTIPTNTMDNQILGRTDASMQPLAKPVEMAASKPVSVGANNTYPDTLTKKYEAGGDPGKIAMMKGDLGGASYGLYQYSAKMGSLQEFLKATPYGQQFKGLKPGSSAFNNKWRRIAKNDPGFGKAQSEYFKKNFYGPVRARADKLGLPNNRAVNNALWSTAAQHGPGGARKIVSRIARPGMSTSQTLRAIYDKRSSIFRNSKYYSKTPARRNIRDNVIKRFRRELKDAMRLTK